MIRELGLVKCRQLCENLFQRVLNLTDFSKCADAAFQEVKRLGAAVAQEVVLLHIQDERVMKHRSQEQLAEFDRLDTERLEELRKILRLFGIQTRIMLRHGIPFQETLKVAEEEKPCLIVLGSHGRSAVQEMLTGSTLENVVRLSHQPVLAVRREIIEHR